MPEAGFDLETVRVRGLDRDATWKNLALPVLIPLALRSALRIVDRFRPDVVLGMGGYVMAPAVAAARMRRIPYVLHEKDVRPGLATHPRVVLTGVPLRDGFVPRSPSVPPRVLLVTGGSQGARRLNQAVWSVLDALCARFEEVIHVAGAQGTAGVAQHARERYRGFAFADDMPALMGRADLVISRAGVGTIAEAVGGGHQEENAEAMVEAGAAIRIADDALTGEALMRAIERLDADRLRAMAKASAAAGRRDAAVRVLAVLHEVARN